MISVGKFSQGFTVAVCAGLTGLLPSSALAGSITIDGQTATSITSAPGGSAIVKVAPANAAKHSRNTYKSFNVDAKGATFDNTTAGATLILNEVTSSEASTLAGPISITGTSADLVLANPNGISVNGAEFKYSGRTLLTTGARNGVDSNGLPRYALSTGTISFTGSGAKTNGSALFAYAPNVSVTGDVSTGAGEVDLTAGRGQLSVGSTSLLGWLNFAQDGAGGQITVGSGATLSGGSIRMVAEGANAGVRMAGTGLATAGNFQINSDGTISLNGRNSAHKTLFVTTKTGDINVTGTQAAKAELSSATEAVQLISGGGISAKNFQLTGAGRGFFGFATNAAISLRANKDIRLNDGKATASTSDIEAVSEAGIFGSGLTFGSAKDVNLTSAENLSFQTSTMTAAERALVESTKGDVVLEQITLTSRLGTRMIGRDISLISSPTHRSLFTVSEGGLSFTATRDFLNDGALVQGKDKSAGDAKSLGGVSVDAEGKVTNRSASEASIGSLYSTGSVLTVKAKGGIDNLSGRILSEKDISITSEGQILNGVLEIGETDAGLATPTGAANFGNYAFGKEIGQIVATENLTLKAASFLNFGGDVSAKAISIDVDSFHNRPERFGTQNFTRRCILFFCRSTGTVSVTHDGGSIVASEALSISARTKLLNEGGNLTGKTGLTLTSPNVELKGMLQFQTFNRPVGLSGLFGGSATFGFVSFEPGTVSSETGALSFVSKAPVVVEKTTMTSPKDVVAANGLTKPDLDAWLAARNARKLGFFRFFLSGRS